MNVIASLLPIILSLFIFGFIIFLTKRNGKRKKTYLSSKKIRWMLVVYVVILLISVGLFFLIPNEEDAVKGEKISNPGISYRLTEAIYNGHVANIDEKFIAKQWNFSFKQNELTIEAIENDINGISIIVERKDVNSIEVNFYQTPTFIKGMDITDQIKSPHIELSSKTLTITKPKHNELNFTSFKQEFTMSQFQGEDLQDNDVVWLGEKSYIRGEQLLYIRVPKDLKIQVGDDYTGIDYLEE